MALLTATAIANEALVQLMINLAATSVFYRGFEPVIATTPRTGGTIGIRRPAVFTAQNFSDTNAIVEQSADEGEVELTIEEHFDVSVPITARDLTFTLVDFSAQIVGPAMRAIAEAFERYILSKGEGVYNTIGSVGSPVNSLAQLQANVANLTNWLVPMSGRVGIISPFQAADLKGVSDLVRADARGDQGQAIRDALLGRTAGVDWYESQATYKHVSGTLSNGTIMGAKVGAMAKGATVMALSDTVLTGTLVYGDVFTIAGCIDDEGRSYHFMVTDTLDTAATNAIAAVNFKPALPVAVAANAYATFQPTHKIGLVGHPHGLAWACVPPALPMGTPKAAVASFNGLGIRVVMGYNQTAKKDVISFDTFGAAAVIQPELLARWIS